MSSRFSVNNCSMKRFLFTTVLIVAVIGVMLYFTPRSMRDDVFGYADCNATVNIYCRAANTESIDTGLGRQVTCPLSSYKTILSACRDVDGISVTFDGTAADVNAIVSRLRATEVSRQQLDGMVVVCFYSPLIRERVTIDGAPVNVQIAYSQGTITVGYPLILGSY